ncbi:MAG: thiamine phosphate synthase [Chloroflexota bacterium]|nr:thiamine phosphate synthase [Chloroflexota bacterium]
MAIRPVSEVWDQGRDPALMLVTDPLRLRGRALADVVRAAVEGGVTIVQLRDRKASHAALLRDGALVREAIGRRARFFVNGDVGAAIALGADGVHLPEAAAPAAAARARVAGSTMLVSRAVHSVEAALRAERDGADIVQAGTLFETASKPGACTLGIDGLRAICDAVRLPVIAIGGVTAANAGRAIEAGAAGVAVIGAIFDADDTAAAARALRAALDGARARTVEPPRVRPQRTR